MKPVFPSVKGLRIGCPRQTESGRFHAEAAVVSPLRPRVAARLGRAHDPRPVGCPVVPALSDNTTSVHLRMPEVRVPLGEARSESARSSTLERSNRRRQEGVGCQSGDLTAKWSDGASGSASGAGLLRLVGGVPRSGGPPFVAVVQTAHLGKRHDFAGVGTLHGAALRRVLVQSQVRTTPMVIADVVPGHPANVGWAEDDHVIQESAPKRCQAVCAYPTTVGCTNNVPPPRLHPNPASPCESRTTLHGWRRPDRAGISGIRGRVVAPSATSGTDRESSLLRFGLNDAGR